MSMACIGKRHAPTGTRRNGMRACLLGALIFSSTACHENARTCDVVVADPRCTFGNYCFQQRVRLKARSAMERSDVVDPGDIGDGVEARRREDGTTQIACSPYVASLIGERVVLEGRTTVVQDYSPASEQGPAPRSMTVIYAVDPPQWLNEHVQARTVEIDGAMLTPTSASHRIRASGRLLVNRRPGRDPSLTPFFALVD